MNAAEITGIIDIGSNTVRLAVYRSESGGAYRIVDQGRWPARLSRRLTKDGRLPEDAILELSQVLLHYRRICSIHGAGRIRAVATAAIRAAVNREEVLGRLHALTGLRVEILSGEEEARLGSQAMLRTLGVDDGYVVDIGGGSTEVTLFRNREIQAAASFPVGCVNTAARFELGDAQVGAQMLERIQAETLKLFHSESWIGRVRGLPLVGLGGTVRAFAKLRQRETEYPFPLLHGYEQSEDEVEGALDKLSALSAAGRKKLPGLSKDRADVIVPGLAILRAVMRSTGSPRLVVCGVGLRDGLFFETVLPPLQPASRSQALEDSVRNLNALYPAAPAAHLEQVRRLSLILFDRLAEQWDFPAQARLWLETAARLFKVGAAIDLNEFADHTFYILMHTHWNGLSHREMLLTAAIASFRGGNALRRKLSPYRSMLQDTDFDIASKLGSLIQLAAALDRSESQAIRSLKAVTARNRLVLEAIADDPLPVERMEVDALAKDFKKTWGLTPVLNVL